MAAQSAPACDLERKFPDGSFIRRRQGSGKIELNFVGRGAELSDTADLRYLLTNGCRTSYAPGSLQDLLNSHLECTGAGFRRTKGPSGEDWFGGSPHAANSYGSASFNYAIIEQFYSDRKSQARGETNGLECYAATAFNLYKSLGLIRPDLDRKETELRYTTMHGQNRGALIGARHFRALRGYYDSPFTAALTLELGRALQNSDWAKLTGSDSIQFHLEHLREADLRNELQKGRTVFAAFNPAAGFAGHAFLLTGYEKNGSAELLRADESYAWQPAKRIPFVKDGYALLYALRGR